MKNQLKANQSVKNNSSVLSAAKNRKSKLLVKELRSSSSLKEASKVKPTEFCVCMAAY
ncbi:MAG: hypothetical protein K2X81_03960 [Candidatus Obscuribacterales bacterium]|nr:hypothetical protein [Candidatus Obscuribacterales bacterium]